MVLKATFGLFACGLAGSAFIGAVQFSDRTAAGYAASGSPSLSRESSNDEASQGIAVAQIAAEHPFAAFGRHAGLR